MIARVRASTQMKRLLEAFDRGDEIDFRVAMEVAFISERTAYRYLAELRSMRLIHIDRYEYRSGHYVPIYAGGKGPSARPPKPKSGAERVRTYRERHRVPKPDPLTAVFSQRPKK